ncbi:MAG: hypothetical protein ACI97A_004204 [Planctomycetota bacterium]|jgi:hypothetical protein
MIAPNAETVSELFSNLLCEEIEFASAVAVRTVDQSAKAVACLLIDDDDQTVGAVVADLTAAVSLGGQLMMLPVGGLEEQIEENSPSAIVIDAVSELFNNFTTVVNSLEENPHVRSRVAEDLMSLVEDGEDWLLSADSSTEYTGQFLCGKGVIQMIEKVT